MSEKSLQSAQQLRQPRGAIRINGTVVQGWTELEVNNNIFYHADTFRIQFALSMLPVEHDQSWWSKQRSVSVEVFVGFPADPERYSVDDLDSLIYGNVDEIDIDPVGGVMELHGRDLTSLLIDTKATEDFRNRRSYEIATIIAERHGLTPIVTKTKAISGSLYQIDHARLRHQQSEWDLLTKEAQKEQYVVYVKGRELHFKPRPDRDVEPYVLQWQDPREDVGHPTFNGMRIRFTRSMTVAKGIVVKVESWNPKTKKKYAVTYPAGRAKGISPGQSSAEATVYSFTRPGLTPAQAIQLAEAFHREITQHEMKLSADIPGDNVLIAGMPLKVIGTGMDFDQTYFVDSVTRRVSFNEGYSMSLSAKNVSPDLDLSI